MRQIIEAGRGPRVIAIENVDTLLTSNKGADIASIRKAIDDVALARQGSGVASIRNVVLRQGTFHFRRVIPIDLRTRIGRRELVRSLATGDPRDAQMRASQLYVASERLFMAVRRDPMLTDAQLASLVQAFFAHVLDEENRRRLSGPYLTEAVREARRDYWEAVAAKSKDSLACNRLEDASWVTEAMLQKQGLPQSSLSREEIAQVKQAMLRAGADLAEALKARYDGDFNYEPRDKLLKFQLAEFPQLGGSPETAAPATTVQKTVEPGPLMSEVGKAFRERQIATKNWDLQTSAQASATYRLFIDVCGDKPIDAYSRQDAGRFREQIERLPNDYGRSAASKSLNAIEIIAAQTAIPVAARSPVISQKTVKRHFSALSALWAQAVPKGAMLSAKHGAAHDGPRRRSS